MRSAMGLVTRDIRRTQKMLRKEAFLIVCIQLCPKVELSLWWWWWHHLGSGEYKSRMCVWPLLKHKATDGFSQQCKLGITLSHTEHRFLSKQLWFHQLSRKASKSLSHTVPAPFTSQQPPPTPHVQHPHTAPCVTPCATHPHSTLCNPLTPCVLRAAAVTSRARAAPNGEDKVRSRSISKHRTARRCLFTYHKYIKTQTNASRWTQICLQKNIKTKTYQSWSYQSIYLYFQGSDVSLSSERLSVVQQQDLLLWWGRDGLQTRFQNHLKTFCISIWKPLDVYFSADPFNPCRIINLPRRLPRTPWRIRKASVFRFPISDKQVSHFQLSPLLHQNHFSKLDFARKKTVLSHIAILCWYWIMMMSAVPPGAHNALRDLPWITYTGAISPYCSIVILDYATRHFFWIL